MNIRSMVSTAVSDRSAAPAPIETAPASDRTAFASDEAEQRTRDRVLRLLLNGPATARDVAGALGLTAAGVRRHLDALSNCGAVTEVDPPAGPRGRGRPARRYGLTTVGRNSFPHAYDELAVNALRHLRQVAGDGAVAAFARSQVADLEVRLGAAIAARPDDDRASVIAETLSGNGYAAVSADTAHGVQVCQHHCPVAHVAAEFPQLCEAETEVLSRVLGSHVQRLATIAHGDGVCTTHVPRPSGATHAPRPSGASHSLRPAAQPPPGKRQPAPHVEPDSHQHSPSTTTTPSARTSR